MQQTSEQNGKKGTPLIETLNTFNNPNNINAHGNSIVIKGNIIIQFNM